METAAFLLVMFLFGFSIGRRLGKREGLEEGIALAPLMLRHESLQKAHCALCGARYENSVESVERT